MNLCFAGRLESQTRKMQIYCAAKQHLWHPSVCLTTMKQCMAHCTTQLSPYKAANLAQGSPLLKGIWLLWMHVLWLNVGTHELHSCCGHTCSLPTWFLGDHISSHPNTIAPPGFWDQYVVVAGWERKEAIRNTSIFFFFKRQPRSVVEESLNTSPSSWYSVSKAVSLTSPEDQVASPL